jgi:hypothetical protein
MNSTSATALFILAMIIILPGNVYAGESKNLSQVVDFNANPYEQIGKLFHVEPWLLYSVAKVESNLNPFAINYRGKSYHFKTRQQALSFLKQVGKNVDVGLGQVNCAIWSVKLRVECHELLDPWLNLAAMALILRHVLNTKGDFWHRVGLYHSSKRHRAIPYAWRVFNTANRSFANNNRRR